ncbi:SPOR domain-containing protein [Ectothiorhodospiraceae bacterium WFHF3C12]|nr:SPOR domain-containing protein [Ectothiorhodospiraceae bacterium WFHF3C12]
MLLTGPVDRGQVSVPVEIPPKPQVQPSSQLPEPEDETARREPPASISEAPSPVDEMTAPEQETSEAATPDAEATAGADEPPDAAGGQSAAPDEPEDSAASAEAEEPAEQAATETAEAATREPEGVPEQGGYAVQVGGFRNRSNALGLRDRLRDEGFTVYVDQTDWKGAPLYRVRVGPVIGEDEAESLKARLEREQDLAGIVVSR